MIIITLTEISLHDDRHTSACLIPVWFPWSWLTGGPAARCCRGNSSSSLAPWRHSPSSPGGPIGAASPLAPPLPSGLQDAAEEPAETWTRAGLRAGTRTGKNKAMCCVYCVYMNTVGYVYGLWCKDTLGWVYVLKHKPGWGVNTRIRQDKAMYWNKRR